MFFRKISVPPILSLNGKNTENYFPAYSLKKWDREIPLLYFYYYRFLLGLIEIFVRFRLRVLSRKYKSYKNPQELTNEEIERVYAREAYTYERKHHITTNYRDTWWRRQSGLDVLSHIFNNSKQKETIKLLDIATGVGLSLEEMFRVFAEYNVAVEAVGLDYNVEMLKQAETIILPRIFKQNFLEKNKRTMKLVRGDARHLSVDNEKNQNKSFTYFETNSIDCITIMFGIGGIDKPLLSFREQLMILKPGGIISMNDMHMPIFDFPEKWPWYIGSKYADVLSMIAWQFVTKPLVLGTLWGWRDPTSDFYLLPFVAIYDLKNDRYYGFKVQSFFLDNEYWSFSIPVMPTAKIVVEKIEIDKEEFIRRNELIHGLGF